MLVALESRPQVFAFQNFGNYGDCGNFGNGVSVCFAVIAASKFRIDRASAPFAVKQPEPLLRSLQPVLLAV